MSVVLLADQNLSTTLQAEPWTEAIIRAQPAKARTMNEPGDTDQTAAQLIRITSRKRLQHIRNRFTNTDSDAQWDLPEPDAAKVARPV